MNYTDSDKAYLRSFRETVDYDSIKVKQQIKKTLLNNKHIIHVLNNKELEDAEAEADDYFGVNILPYYLISPTQSSVQNFLTFQVSYTSIPQYNKQTKFLQIIFIVLCEHQNIIDKDTSLPRHDLLGALIQDQFNNTNICGRKIQLVSDRELVVDTAYAARELVFEQITDNNLVRTRNGTSRLSNKDLYAQVPQSKD
jgi:hypothetical protein